MNQELYNKTYRIPPDVLKYIQTTLVSNPNGEGVKRAKFMLKNGVVTYQVLKRLKNFFDYFNSQTGDKIQYALAGGNPMKAFVEKTLNADRNAVKVGKKVRQDMNVRPNSELNPYVSAPRLNEEKKKEIKKNVVAVIVNSNNKILLLKRADDSKIWMPNKWGLVGGAIEKGENAKQAIEREILEETKLDVKKFVKSLTIQRHPESSETIFACRYDGEDTDVKLNEENTKYGWYDIPEMKFLDIVPHLLEYITLVFKKYE